VSRRSRRDRSLWVVDPARSAIRFAVAVGHLAGVQGCCARFSGLLVWDDRSGQPVAVGVEIDAGGVVAGQTQCDLRLHPGDFLDVETYPTITFGSRRLDVLRADRIRVSGALRLHGVVRPIELEATLAAIDPRPDGCDTMRFTATTDINRYDFGLRWSQPLDGVRIGDRIHIELDIVAVRVEPGADLGPVPAGLDPILAS